MLHIKHFIDSEEPNSMLSICESDYDYCVYEGKFIGQVTDGLNFSNSLHCGCEHDCCGCVSYVQQSAEQLDGETILITKTYNYNY